MFLLCSVVLYLLACLRLYASVSLCLVTCSFLLHVSSFIARVIDICVHLADVCVHALHRMSSCFSCCFTMYIMLDDVTCSYVVALLICWFKGALVSHIWVCRKSWCPVLIDIGTPLFQSGSEGTWFEAFRLFVLRLPPVFDVESCLSLIEDEWFMGR